jgi:hypothetical protein
VRDIDYQLLNHLAGMSGALRDPLNATLASLQNMALGASYQGKDAYASGLVNRLSSARETASADPFHLDPLSIDDCSMMPSSGVSGWDEGLSQGAGGKPLFEYWIEDVVF